MTPPPDHPDRPDHGPPDHPGPTDHDDDRLRAVLDPEIAAALEDLPPALDASRGVAAFVPDERPLPPADDDTLHITDVKLPGLDDNPAVAARTYRRRERTPDAGRGVLVLHGGGFVSGGVGLADPTLRDLTRELDAVVVAPTYRLAPAHPFPAAFDDCRAALAWLADQPDVDRLVAFGVSSGGALAAGLALHARDHGGPTIDALVLGFPVTDDRLVTPSSHEVTDLRIWNRGMAELSWQAYLGDAHGTDDVSPYAAPMRVVDPAGLPPTTITVDQHDPLRDEGIAWAQRLMHAGVRTELHAFPGTFHGSMGFAPDASVSRRELRARVDAIARA